jgi:hypothetical protein
VALKRENVETAPLHGLQSDLFEVFLGFKGQASAIEPLYAIYIETV